MTTIETRIKPYSLKSLMYWNDFILKEDGIYERGILSNKIKDVRIDFSNYHRGIIITYKLNEIGTWMNKKVVLERLRNWHENVYEELLIWLISRMDNMKLPNFDKYK